MTLIDGSTPLDCLVGRKNIVVSADSSRPDQAGGPTTMISGPSCAGAADSSGVSAHTIVSNSSSFARTRALESWLNVN